MCEHICRTGVQLIEPGVFILCILTVRPRPMGMRKPVSCCGHWLFGRPLSVVPASILSCLHHLCSLPHSLLPDCLNSAQSYAPSPVLPLQKVFPNHLNPCWPPLPLHNWDRFFYLQPILKLNHLVFCWSCCFVCIYLMALTDSSLKSWAGLYYFPKPQLKVKWWHGTRAFDSCWVTWAELGRPCDPPRGCWVYLLQALLMSTVYSSPVSVGPENTEVCWVPGTGFASSPGFESSTYHFR